ncbi:MAG: hypothetical protein LAP85_24740 [Acidobacteriia bacterium]|nr:hypothetical protein [Terriglobia bacterium]
MTPNQPTPVIYRWPLAKSLALFLPAVVILPFLFVKANRRAGIWLVLVPFALATAVSLVNQVRPISWISRPISYIGSYFVYASQIVPALRASFTGETYLYIIMLASGLCMLCLMAHWLARLSFFKKFLAGLVLLALPGMLTMELYQSADAVSAWGVPIAFLLVSLVVLASLSLTAKMVKKHWNILLFTVLFFCWNFIFLFVLRIAYYVSFIIRQPSVRPQWWNVLMPRLATIWQGPTTFFVLVLLFIVTAFLIPAYRERLRAVFKVAPAPPPEQPQAASAQAGA